MILAAIDIGTNALRILISEVRMIDGRIDLVPLFHERRITRLGEGIADSGNLSSPAISRAMFVLQKFQTTIREYPVERVLTVATSAVREAENRQVFLDQVKEVVGLEVEVLSGKEEARRTLRGVRHGLESDAQLGRIRNFIVMDIGGGSTEWIVVTDREIQELISAEIGVVKLSERYHRSDSFSQSDQRDLLTGIEEAMVPVFASIKGLIQPSHRTAFIGTAGTVTTLASLELGLKTYDAARVQNMRLSRPRIESWFQKLSGMTLKERRALAGLEKGREDLIIPGTALLLATMLGIGAEEVIVSDWGLREGVLIDYAERCGFRPTGTD